LRRVREERRRHPLLHRAPHPRPGLRSDWLEAKLSHPPPALSPSEGGGFFYPAAGEEGLLFIPLPHRGSGQGEGAIYVAASSAVRASTRVTRKSSSRLVWTSW